MLKQLEVAQPGELLSINRVHGRRWEQNWPTKKAWKDAGFWHGSNVRSQLMADEGLETPLSQPVFIQFDFDVRDRQRRDGHNYASTVCKWFIDGLVQAKVLIDDSAEYLRLEDPTFRLVEGKWAAYVPMMMRVRIST
jgi:hypothetical protein